jgi:hypothetical protein
MIVSKWVTIGGLVTLSILTFVVTLVVPTEVKSSSKVTLHSAYKGVGTLTNVTPNRTHWGGIYWGHSFNDSMSGFLHKAVWNCPAAADIADGQVTFKGYCTLTDADGNKVFGDWSGSGPLTGEITGRLKMTGGSRRYATIKGSLDFQCKGVGTDDQLFCTQQVEYELP